MLTFSGSRQALFSFTTCPATLNARSDGTEVAGIHKNFLANCANHVDSVSDCLSTILEGYPLY